LSVSILKNQGRVCGFNQLVSLGILEFFPFAPSVVGLFNNQLLLEVSKDFACHTRGLEKALT
jgi:hypothetical protein